MLSLIVRSTENFDSVNCKYFILVVCLHTYRHTYYVCLISIERNVKNVKKLLCGVLLPLCDVLLSLFDVLFFITWYICFCHYVVCFCKYVGCFCHYVVWFCLYLMCFCRYYGFFSHYVHLSLWDVFWHDVVRVLLFVIIWGAFAIMWCAFVVIWSAFVVIWSAFAVIWGAFVIMCILSVEIVQINRIYWWFKQEAHGV